MDVALALVFAGLAYLVWALVAGVSRATVQEMIRSTAQTGKVLPDTTRLVKVFFVDSGFVIDLAGLGWLALSLVLLAYSSRQRIGISWVWVSAVCQSFVAALGAVLVGWAAYQPHIAKLPGAPAGGTLGEQVSSISLPITMTVALLIWVMLLVWLLIERARFNRRYGPSLRDGLHTNVFR